MSRKKKPAKKELEKYANKKTSEKNISPNKLREKTQKICFHPKNPIQE